MSQAVHRISSQSSLQALRSHRFFMRSAFSISNLFAWIFIFQYFAETSRSFASAVLSCALLYALSQDITLLLTPLSAGRLRNGSRAPMTQGVLFASLSFFLLAAGMSGLLGAKVIFGILAYSIFYGAYRALYWVPYEVDVSHIAGHKSISSYSFELFFAILPAISGFVLSFGYPSAIFVLLASGILMCASLIPLRHVPVVHEDFSWKYTRTFHELLDRRYRALVITALADGFAGGALLLFWPIAAYIIVGRSFAMLGVVLTITFLLVMLARSVMRRYFRHLRIERSPAVHAVIAASSWIMRLIVSSPFGIVLVDSYFYVGNTVRGTGIDPLIFEQAADKGSYIDELTALKELALSIGKICICMFGAALTVLISLPMVFIIVFMVAGVASAIAAYYARAVQIVGL